MLGRSHYLHATVYTFSQEAFSSVISQFHKQVADEAVQCWYDESQHAFHIECPIELAGNTDEILGGQIASYISQELAAAAAAEQREPANESSIQLFPEANMNAPDSVLIPLTVGQTPSVDTKVSRSHVVLIPRTEVHGKVSNLSVELHGLRDLPDQISGRIIQPDKKAARKLIKNGRTCRMVHWDEDEYCYVPDQFSSGDPPQTFARAKTQVLDLAPFHIVLDNRAKTDAVPVKGVESGINTMEWLNAVEKADTLELEAKQDMPADTLKLLVRQPRATARVRLPKGVLLEEGDDEPECQPPDENDAPKLEIPNSAFHTGPQASRDPLENSTGDTPKASNDDLQSILDAPFSSAVSEQAHKDAKTLDYPTVQDDFGSWDKSFAVVDKYGLTSDPRSAAQFDLERRHQRQLAARSKASVSALQRVTGSQAMSVTHPSPARGRPGSRARSGSALPHHDTQTPSSDPASTPSWANRVVERTIDDLQAVPPTMINLLDGESFPSLTEWKPLRPDPAGAQRAESGTQDSQPDQIVESLRAPSKRSTRKRNTMGQKARPKQSKKRVPARVQLPLPDPVPPPKSRKQKSESSRAEEVSALLVQPTHQHQEKEPVDDNRAILSRSSCHISSIPSEECSHDFCQTLKRGLTERDPDALFLEAHIGMAVVRATKYESLIVGTFHFDEAENNLNSAEASVETDFFRALTTSNSDAAFIHFGLEEFGEVRDENIYEVHFRRPDGDLLVATIGHSDKEILSVVTSGRLSGEAFLHYPTHVWDAHLILRENPSESSVSEALELFVTSMETINEAPSFKAMVKGAYFPIAAYAKRVYSVEHDDLTFNLSQVHELKLQNVGDEQHNFAAYVERVPWWEVTVNSDIGNLAGLKEHVDSLVTLMDPVGADNEGIQMKKKKKNTEMDEKELELEMYGVRYAKFEPADLNNVFW